MDKLGVSVVINTLNEEENIKKCLESVSWAQEIIIVDMGSLDKTVDIAKETGAKVFFHPPTGYVEPARNYAIEKATKNWILIVDADEEISDSLRKKIEQIIASETISYVRIPRKNIAFGKWIRHTGWWPDYKIRLFKKGSVNWQNEIHSIPITYGKGIDLSDKEEMAIIHHNYKNISQFVERLNRYTNFQKEAILVDGYKFKTEDLVAKPIDEFLSRFFLLEGYKDGAYGLVLSMLMAFYSLVTYLKIWEIEGFKAETENKFLDDFAGIVRKKSADFYYWLFKKRIEESRGFLTKIKLRIVGKLRRFFN